MARSNFIVRGGADFSGIKKELTKTQAQLQGFQAKVSSIMKGIGTVLGSLAVGKLIKDSTKAAMGVESAIDNIGRNMGEAASSFQQWVNAQSKALGMAKADAYQYGSIFSNLLSSFLSSAEETANQTQDLMKTAAIIASKTGRTYDDVANRIRSGMLGSTEAIEDLGVYVNISMLEATDAFKKFAGNKSWSQLTFQQQQQIRLAAIMEQTYKRYGDTLADTTQTRQAQFLASLKNIQLTLGQAFLPIYNAVLPALTDMANAIEKVVSVFAQFTQALFGKATTSQTKATQQQAAAVSDLGDATEKAGKQAKNSVAGFDEIHQLAEENAGTGATTAIAPTGAAPTDTDEIISAEEPNKMTKLAEKFKKAFEPAAQSFERLKKAAEPIINNIWQGLKWFYDNVLVPFGSWVMSEAVPAFLDLIAATLSVLNPIIEAFKPLAQWLWENFLLPVTQWTGQAFINAINLVTQAFRGLGDWMSQNQEMVTAGLAGILAGILAYKAINTMPKILNGVKLALQGLGASLSTLMTPAGLIAMAIAALTTGFIYFYTTNEKFRGVVDSILKAIADAAIYLWENVLKPFGEFLGTVFVAAWNAVTTAAEWLWQNVLVPFGEFLEWLWQQVFEPIAAVLADVLAVAFYKVAQIAKSFWENVLVPLGNALAEMFGPAVEAVSAVLSFLWKDVFVPFGDFIMGIFKGIIEDLIKVFEFLWYNVLKPLAEFIGGAFVGTFDSVFRSIGTIIDGLKDIFIGLMNFITGVFTGSWEKAWEGVRKIFKGIFESLWGIVKFPFNQIIEGLNTLIGGLNKLSFDVPDWVPGIGGKSFGINIPLIPKLETGTNYVPQDMFAYLHEGEAVIPKKYNPAATGFQSADLVNAIASAVGSAVLAANQVSSTGRSNNEEIILEMDGTRVGRVLLNKLNEEAIRLGYKPILRTT